MPIDLKTGKRLPASGGTPVAKVAPKDVPVGLKPAGAIKPAAAKPVSQTDSPAWLSRLSEISRPNISSTPAPLGSFTAPNDTALTSNQIQGAQNDDFERQRGVFQQRATDLRSQQVNDKTGTYEQQLEMAGINMRYNRDDMYAAGGIAKDQINAQGQVQKDVAQIQGALGRATNADSQQAETERQKIAANAQTMSSLLGSVNSGNFRYW
jgi:hypothetical protein